MAATAGAATTTTVTATVEPRSQLARLVARFPERFIDRDPGGNLYVSHSTVNEWLLGVVGPFSFELVTVIRGDVAEVPPNPQGQSKRAKAGTPALSGVVVGGVWRLVVELDGRTVRVEEAGDCEDPANWRHDGQRLKQVASDALKRCAMRVGLGLHLWSGDAYVLDQRLTTTTSSNGSNSTTSNSQGEEGSPP